LLAALLEAVLRRPLAVLLAWAAFAALCVAVVLPMRVDGRVEAFLPERDRHLADYSDALQRFGLAGTMFVDVEAPQGAPMREAVDRVRGSLAGSGLVREILGAPDEAARMRTARALAPEVPLLLPEEAYGDMEARLDSGDLRSRMEEHYERLVGPAGGVYQQVLRGDPLELGTLAMTALARFPGTPGQRFEGGALLSADGRHALLTAIPAATVGDEAAAVALESLMDGIARDLGDRARLTWVGGHRFYLANSRTIQADVQRVSMAALLLVLAIVFAGFRAARILGLAGLAVAVASLGGLAAGVLVFGPVSGVALAFGGALGGICVDYVLHLHAVPRAGEARVEAVRRVYLEIGPTVVIGAITSAAAFLVLLASPVPVHRQIGVVAAAGILVALAFSLTAGPVLAAGRPRQEKAPAEPRPTPFDRLSGAWFGAVLRRPGAALGIALVLLAASAAASPSLRIEKDLRRFESKDPATVEAERAFTAAWGGMLSRPVVLVPGDDLQAALRGAEDLETVLRSGGAAGGGVLGPSAVLPSLRTQDRRWERWRGFWTEARVARLREDLAGAAGEFGIRKGTFEPFFESLAVRPPPVTPEVLRGTAFDAVLSRHVHEVDGKYRVLLLAPRLAEPGAGGDFVRDVVEVAAPGARVLTGKGLADAVADATFGELTGLALPALALVGILLAWYYRRVGTVLVALFPLVGGLVLMAGILVAAGEPLSMLSIPAVIPVFGMGVDYGVFLIDALDGAPRGGDAVAAVGRRSAPVLGAMLTTLATGAALLLAKHPGFRTLGIAMLAGVGSSFLLAWLAVPRLAGWKGTAR
jgi:predicted exporter